MKQEGEAREFLASFYECIPDLIGYDTRHWTTQEVLDVMVAFANQEEDEKKTQVDWDKLRDAFNNITGKKTRVVNKSVKSKIMARLKEGWTKEDIMKTIRMASVDPHHVEKGLKYVTLEFISRPNIIERYTSMTEESNKFKDPSPTN